MVVIEGPDGAGKSTLAAQLSKWLGLEIYHCSKDRTRDGMREEDLHSIKTRRDMIHDRIHLISEPVYGPILRNSNELSGEDLLYRQFMLIQPFVIYCRVPVPYLKIGKPSEFETEDHHAAARAKARELSDAYDRNMVWFTPCIYDWTQGRTHRAYEIACMIMEGRLDRNER